MSGFEPARNLFWRLDQRPEGDNYETALSLQEAELTAPVSGEVIVRNKYISLDPGTRMWMSPREDSYMPPLPLGATMAGLGMGEVYASNHPDFAEGDLVRGFGHWAQYSTVNAEEAGLTKLDAGIDDWRQHLGALGFNALTALWGIAEIGQAKPGDKVLVSAAAGCTGLLACQIALALGCEVYGIAGGPDKCAMLENEYGVHALDYKAGGLADKLSQVEGGFNIYFDNVGGEILEAALDNMALLGRIAVCGMIADYENTPTQPKNYDQVLMKRLLIQGFLAPDFAEHMPAMNARLLELYRSGQINSPFDETAGIENILSAYRKLFTGGNIGKTVVKLY
ncbi:MAG: NADP-dependent oxidoreductase [Parvibaculales bacterium]